MRRLYQFLAGILAIIFFLWGISAYMQSRTGSVSDKLVIYNWGDYIDPDLLTKFTKKRASRFSTKPLIPMKPCILRLSRAGQPTISLCHQTIPLIKWLRKHLLVKLDKSKIKGFDQIGSSFKGLSFDPNNDYSIPYFWGTVGIVYNTKLVKKHHSTGMIFGHQITKTRLC